ncbi:atherin-like [Mastomys coucha]|uniref:atherin-like n=1 Tax=Mastomys coucha TaxID=35658 RepID=UPI00126171A9|nr:atherin-like [Mastomys coucha]
MPSHRTAPSPTSRGRTAPVLNGTGASALSGPIWPPALAPAWPPGGLSRVAASRLAVPRPASLQRHPAGPNRHPSRRPGPAPASPHLAPFPHRTRAAIAAAPFCPPPRPPRSSVSRSWAQTEVTRRRALPALTSRERTDSTWSARREPNCCLRTRYCAATAAAAAASSAAAAAAHGS